MPADTALRILPKTVAKDRLIDKIVFSFTRDVIDWRLPGVHRNGHRCPCPVWFGERVVPIEPYMHSAERFSFVFV